uniref:Uncharacterized protein n=1 Tax=Arundo donax TaxID=35708 RepID=A0A0A9DHU2_ARUDO
MRRCLRLVCGRSASMTLSLTSMRSCCSSVKVSSLHFSISLCKYSFPLKLASIAPSSVAASNLRMQSSPRIFKFFNSLMLQLPSSLETTTNLERV